MYCQIRVKARLSNPLPKTQAVKGAMCGGFRIGRTGSGNFTRFGIAFFLFFFCFEILMLLQLVPRRFVREYGREISDYVQVKDPSGRSWKLGWSKCGGEIWLKNG